MVIMVVDVQGVGIGKALIERLKTVVGAEHELIAVGTNAMATMGMMKGGAKSIATGENAVIYNAKRADIIVGSIGIISANAMLGELSPAMAAAIGESDAVKILIPLNRCGLRVAGVATDSLPAMMDDAVRMVVDYINKNSEN